MNPTITVQEDLLKRARMRALEKNTSVNAVLRKFLESYVDTTRQQRAVDRLLALSRTTRAGRGVATRRGKWARDELHDR